MHSEWYEVGAAGGRRPSRPRAQRGGRVVAVGTTALRALESAARGGHGWQPGQGETDLFILPGYRFRVVDRC
jgi:S-adenosylmethionine:tRNA ribosyltransferase-isomerase